MAADSVPEAPDLFSTMTDWPSARVRPSASMRAIRSDGPPAGKPTMMLMVRAGQGAWAKARVVAIAARPPSVARRVNLAVMARPPPFARHASAEFAPRNGDVGVLSPLSARHESQALEQVHVLLVLQQRTVQR